MDSERELAWRRPLLGLLALGFAGFGAAYALLPSDMAALTGIVLPDFSATIDFAATYGGLQLGLAAFLAICSAREELVRPGLMAGGWTLAGIAAVRLAGIALDGGNVIPMLYFGLTLELAGAVLLLLASRR
jgi:Domain of unknown function (DUF4345)